MISEKESASEIARPGPPRTSMADNILRRRNQPLSVFFSPRTVAVLGATESAESIGRTVLWNLVTNPFGGTVFPVNPKHSSVLGIKAYPSIDAVPEKVDLAVLANPPEVIPGLIADCSEAGVKGAIILSAGFKEIGPAL
jgi:acetyltransferase